MRRIFFHRASCHAKGAVTKSGTGTRGPGDAETRGRGDAGTRGSGDARTSELADERGFEDVINE